MLVLLVSCSNNLTDNYYQTEDDNCMESMDVIISNEVIYGKEFSLAEVSESQNRAARFAEEQLVEMVYFSVMPTNMDSVYKISEKIGYLNPIQMNKEIIQACDPDTIIFKDEVIMDENISGDDLINFDIKYYYILPKAQTEGFDKELENYEVLEIFYIPCEDAMEEYEINKETETARLLFNKNKIYGKIQYKLCGKTIPAYGVNMRRGVEYSCQTDRNGSFSLGSKANIGGLCYIWVDYKNDACDVTNILGVPCATLLKVAFPSQLSNVTITADSGYCTGKMAVCAELLTRRENELYKPPKANVWTTELGNGTSSAPCFNLNRKDGSLDIFLTNCDSLNSMDTIRIIHHEYSHYLHNWLVSNKNGFWSNVVSSEIGSSIRYTGIQFINKYIGSNFSANFYDFSNEYVNFTENFAEWYSYVGLSYGTYAKQSNISFIGKNITSSYYKNVKLFSELITYAKISENSVIKIINLKDVITFQEFYNCLLNDYPDKKNEINKVFKSDYQGYGKSIEYK